MVILNRILLLLGVSLIAFGSMAKPQIVTLELPTMNCPVCPITVTKSLEQVDGVTDVEVLYEKKLAQVGFDDESTDIQTLIDATTNAGYPSNLKK